MLTGNCWTYVYKLPITEQTWILITRENGSDPFQNNCEWHGRVKEGGFDDWNHLIPLSVSDNELKERIHSFVLMQGALKKSKTTFLHKEIKAKIKEIFVWSFINHLKGEHVSVAKAALKVLFPQRDVEMYFDYKCKRREGNLQLDKLMCEYIEKDFPIHPKESFLEYSILPRVKLSDERKEFPTAES